MPGERLNVNHWSTRVGKSLRVRRFVFHFVCNHVTSYSHFTIATNLCNTKPVRRTYCKSGLRTEFVIASCATPWPHSQRYRGYETAEKQSSIVSWRASCFALHCHCFLLPYHPSHLYAKRTYAWLYGLSPTCMLPLTCLLSCRGSMALCH